LLLAGEYPGALDEAEARRKIDRFLNAGIVAFFDLTEATEGLEPYDVILGQTARERGVQVEYLRVPIRDLGVPSVDVLRTLIGRLTLNLESSIPTYVHCWGGVGRTGTVVGCWMVERERISGDDAIQKIAALRTRTRNGFKESPETLEQRTMVRRWANLMESGSS